MPDGVLLVLGSAVMVLTVAGVVFTLATDDRDPSIVLAWLFLIVIVPLLGVVAYFFVGRDHRTATARRERQREP
ncbi:MAG TPA: PLDc N-terminal domain-containing protein, partial [Microlunatus sp.]|nr:PLDc N-terminal domain-containing protein [Microlunatus sp.]